MQETVVLWLVPSFLFVWLFLLKQQQGEAKRRWFQPSQHDVLHVFWWMYVYSPILFYFLPQSKQWVYYTALFLMLAKIWETAIFRLVFARVCLRAAAVMAECQGDVLPGLSALEVGFGYQSSGAQRTTEMCIQCLNTMTTVITSPP